MKTDQEVLIAINQALDKYPRDKIVKPALEAMAATILGATPENFMRMCIRVGKVLKANKGKRDSGKLFGRTKKVFAEPFDYVEVYYFAWRNRPVWPSLPSDSAKG